jgi:hypothetical protein
VALAVLNGNVDQLGILRLLGGGENERWVGGSILGFIFADGCGILEFHSQIEGGLELASGRMV